jgi:hypothetical protein
MKNAAFQLATLKAVIKIRSKMVNKMKPGAMKTREQKMLANIRKVANILSKHI